MVLLVGALFSAISSTFLVDSRRYLWQLEAVAGICTAVSDGTPPVSTRHGVHSLPLLVPFSLQQLELLQQLHPTVEAKHGRIVDRVQRVAEMICPVLAWLPEGRRSVTTTADVGVTCVAAGDWYTCVVPAQDVEDELLFTHGCDVVMMNLGGDCDV